MTLSQYRRMRWAARGRGRKLLVPKGPNVNETTFNLLILRGIGRFVNGDGDDAEHFQITDSGKVYTPDFRVQVLGNTTYVEVKGSHALGSQARSRLAWETAAERNQDCIWVWAKASSSPGRRGQYLCTFLAYGGKRKLTRWCSNARDFVRCVEDVTRKGETA